MMDTQELVVLTMMTKMITTMKTVMTMMDDDSRCR